MAIDIDEAKVNRSEVSLWLGWTLATAAGMILGFLSFALIVKDLNVLLARILIPIWAGLLVGLFQWWVLRPYFVHPVDWVLSGGTGWALGFALGLLLIQVLSRNAWGTLLGYCLFGLIIAALQWPILRREIPSALPWVAASMVGWALGASLSQWAVTAFTSGGSAPHPLLSAAITSAVTGLVAGTITGLALVWIVRQPDRQPA